MLKFSHVLHEDATKCGMCAREDSSSAIVCLPPCVVGQNDHPSWAGLASPPLVVQLPDTVQRIVEDLAEIGVHIGLVIARKELRDMNINKYSNRKNIKNKRCRHGRVEEADISDLLAM